MHRSTWRTCPSKRMERRAEPLWAKIAGSQAAVNSPAKTAATFFARFEGFSPASVTVGDHATSKADSRFMSMKAELLHG
jgi:hypothetical protein